MELRKRSSVGRKKSTKKLKKSDVDFLKKIYIILIVKGEFI